MNSSAASPPARTSRKGTPGKVGHAATWRTRSRGAPLGESPPNWERNPEGKRSPAVAGRGAAGGGRGRCRSRGSTRSPWRDAVREAPERPAQPGKGARQREAAPLPPPSLRPTSGGQTDGRLLRGAGSPCGEAITAAILHLCNKQCFQTASPAESRVLINRTRLHVIFVENWAD